MTRATAADIEAARRLLLHEGARGDGAVGAAAGRVYEKIFARLAPLIGGAGVRALFARSVTLVTSDIPALREIATAGQAAGASEEHLVRFLSEQEHAVALDIASRLYATLFALLVTFIGERLVARVLDGAFPGTDDHRATRETE